MISRTQFAAGAILFLQSLALGSNIVYAEIDDSRSLRGQQQDDRDLAPYGYGRGFSYTTNSNRYSYARTRDGSLGSQVLRPYSPSGTVAYQRPGRLVTQPPVVQPSPGGGKAGGKAGKASKGFQPVPTQPTNPGNGGGNVGGGGSRSFAGSMSWERIPGQPLFVSRKDFPVIVLTEPYETATDAQGNTVLVSPDGKVIVIKFDPRTGNWIVQSEDKQNILSFDERGGVVVDPAGNRPEPTVSPAPTDSPEPTIAPTTTPAPILTDAPTSDTDEPTVPPTKQPTRTPTPKPSGNPTEAPTKFPTRSPTKNPTKEPTKEPTKNPTKEPTKEPTKNPTKEPTKNPTKFPTKEPTKNPTKNPTANPTPA